MVVQKFKKDGTSNVINHDLDLRFFIHYCSSQGIDLLKFEIQLRTCVDSISSSSSSARAPASSSSSSCISSDEVVVVEDVIDDACLIKKVPKKSDAWVNILTGVGKLFEGGIVEVNNCVKNLACSDPSKVRMRKSFMKNILADDLRASKKKKTASDVIDLFRMKYGVDLTYSQAYHGLQFTNVTRQFKKFFVSFEASITGFNNYCRPMLFIDCTFLTGKFKGGLMVACGKTGSQEIYPVAFGIVPYENCESWQWLLTNLKGQEQTNCSQVIRSVFTALTKENFYAAAKSMSNLKLDSVVAWMMKIPFEKWAAHAFPRERWGENTSSIAESFNNVIKHDKPLPALELVDVIRAKVMEQNYKRLLESNKWTIVLTPRMQARFNKRISDCHS
ncbi:uncharacterized protein LOC113272446 [Papaver somniferum]|uniref:uncharacterized protein LOC113272446 n=1 Tax=Papaver somniferum TaxID=3469 RepID=UPI000E6FB305|nr:uncharacterized protein LOC113272446 [Papaver somniferum]